MQIHAQIRTWIEVQSFLGDIHTQIKTSQSGFKKILVDFAFIWIQISRNYIQIQIRLWNTPIRTTSLILIISIAGEKQFSQEKRFINILSVIFLETHEITLGHPC